MALQIRSAENDQIAERQRQSDQLDRPLWRELRRGARRDLVGLPFLQTRLTSLLMTSRMTAPTMPSMMAPISPKPPPLTTMPASQPAIAPTMIQIMML